MTSCVAVVRTRDAPCARSPRAARVSLGYLSEVERGQKEASSELLASICTALDVPLAIVLRSVSDEVAVLEGVAPVTELPVAPDTVVAAA